MRIFGADVTFLAAGDVFRTGLAHAAQTLGIEYKSALWNAEDLPQQIGEFEPDLILAIHGRSYAKRWKGIFTKYKQAVWITDDPYEVDDASEYAKQFDYVFVNDRATLNRYRAAHYLPTCYDPSMHYDAGKERIYNTGFIGGANRTRTRYLKVLADARLLSYVVGGPWTKQRQIAPLSLGLNIPPAETAALYQQTKIVLNIWRDIHNFNRTHTRGHSLNPRIYEALACGAMVVSEWRPELDEAFPELPTFRNDAEMIRGIRGLLTDDNAMWTALAHCRARLEGHTYADRLKRIVEVCFK